MVTPASELIVALDVPTAEEALSLREELDGVVGWFKVGSELFTAAGPEIVRKLAPGRIFLDLKFHDIPNTVAGAVAAAARLGVDIVDVHASGGEAMMRAAAEASQRSDASSRPLVFAVTVLTHLGEDDLDAIGVGRGSREQAARLAGLAAACALDGVVASAREVESIRAATEDALEVLVPGVRPAWASAGHDQKRIATPGEAARAGARYVVVGRAITLSPSPRDAAQRIVEELAAS